MSPSQQLFVDRDVMNGKKIQLSHGIRLAGRRRWIVVGLNNPLGVIEGKNKSVSNLAPRSWSARAGHLGTANCGCQNHLANQVHVRDVVDVWHALIRTHDVLDFESAASKNAAAFDPIGHSSENRPSACAQEILVIGCELIFPETQSHVWRGVLFAPSSAGPE